MLRWLLAPLANVFGLQRATFGVETNGDIHAKVNLAPNADGDASAGKHQQSKEKQT
jgi:hypothetical protein